jgi:hypothetical protein
LKPAVPLPGIVAKMLLQKRGQKKTCSSQSSMIRKVEFRVKGDRA